jgi:hypothetical protein
MGRQKKNADLKVGATKAVESRKYYVKNMKTVLGLETGKSPGAG